MRSPRLQFTWAEPQKKSYTELAHDDPDDENSHRMWPADSLYVSCPNASTYFEFELAYTRGLPKLACDLEKFTLGKIASEHSPTHDDVLKNIRA